MFIFVIDFIGVVLLINELYVEMDVVWVLYEVYIKLLIGEVDIVLVYGFGKFLVGMLCCVLFC